MEFIKIAYIFLLIVGIVKAVAVIPRPRPDIEDVTSYSITVNWTLPKNEIFSEFVIEMFPEEGDILNYDGMDTKRTFINLTPGTLYTFELRSVREESFSDTAVILQDTIPLPPTNLQLRYFDTLVLTLEGNYFLNTEFTVETSGIEADWNEPVDGISECYHVTLDPNDGSQATPAEDDVELPGDTMRQFYNLVPGKTYSVTVFSSTCGEGHRGRLLSDGISSDVTLPPANPPTIEVNEVTTSSAELTWDKDPIDGFYDDFKITKSGDNGTTVTVDLPNDPRDLKRNLTQLTACTKYEFDVFTMYQGKESKDPQPVIVNTRPHNPVNLVVKDYSENMMTISWEHRNQDMLSGFIVEVLPKIESIETKDTSIELKGLKPGVDYTISILSVCNNEEKTTSFPTIITQTTKPIPPSLVTSECSYVGRTPVENDPYDLVPWDAPEPSKVTLRWSKPTNGSWDGFIVHYSPYEYEQGLPTPSSPMIFGPDVTTTQITVPVSGRVITTSIRTISRNIASEPIVKQTMCGDIDGESSLRCRNMLIYWNIKITPIQDNTKLLIEIPNFPILNATVHLEDPPREVLVFYNNTFIVRNPCVGGPASKITVYPNCPDVLPYCPVITRRLCLHRGGFKEFVAPNACCHSKLYSTDDQICCHNKLINKFERKSEECCVSRWYDRQTHKCCGQDEFTGFLMGKNGSC